MVGLIDYLLNGDKIRANQRMSYELQGAKLQNELNQQSNFTKLFGGIDPNQSEASKKAFGPINWNPMQAPTGNAEVQGGGVPVMDAIGTPKLGPKGETQYSPLSYATMPLGKAQADLKTPDAPNPIGTLPAPAGFQQQRSVWARGANPEAAMTYEANQARLAPFLGSIPEKDRALALFAPEKYAEQLIKQRMPDEPGDLKLVQGLTAKIAEIGAGTPEAKSYEDLLAAKTYNEGKDPTKQSLWRAQTESALANAAKDRAGATKTQMVEGLPTGLSGQAFLEALPKDMETLVPRIKAIAEGRETAPRGVANPTANLLMAAVEAYDPTYTVATAPVRIQMQKELASGKNGLGANRSAINTAIGHIADLAKSGEELNNSSFTPYNFLANKAAQKTGSDKPTNFNLAAIAVSEEMAKAFKGAPGALAEVEAWHSALSPDMSPEQIKGAATKATKLLRSRLDAMADQYNQGMGTEIDGDFFLNDQSRKILHKIESPAAEKKVAEAPPKPADAPADARVGTTADGSLAWFSPDPARPGKYIQW